jgi:hypothetical protein
MFARYTNLIVHRSGYMTDQSGEIFTASHFIDDGDFGVPIFNVTFALLHSAIGLTYLPLKAIEKQYWYIVIPMNSTWPYSNAI